MKKPVVAGAEVGPSELVAFKECQDVLRSRLTRLPLRLVPELTGLRFHVLWHRPLDFVGPGEIPVLCPAARHQRGAKKPWLECCESCLQRRWKSASRPTSRGRQFIGPCGLSNFCASLHLDKLCLLTLVLQARVASRSPSSCRLSQDRNTRFWAKSTGKPASRVTFGHAVDLARLILHDLESAARARTARSELNNTQTEAVYPHEELRPRLPSLPQSTIPKSHTQKLVEEMADYVHQHYYRPISLKDLTSVMKRNASYLSALFSQTTGITFHHYLEVLRLSKAKELLRDPRNRVGEVARAVGYASPISFRHAFKAHLGLSPEAWRARQ
jgi:AraC-like DNA-binding protein